MTSQDMTFTKMTKTCRDFVNDRGRSGARGLELVFQAINHAFDHGDWTGLAWLLNKLEEKEAKIMRRIVGACVTGIKAERDSPEARAQPHGMILKGFEGGADRKAKATNKLGLLAELVADKKAFNSKAVADALFPSNKVEKAWDLKEAIAVYERAIDKIIDHGFDLSDVLRAFNEARSNVTEAEQARDARKGK